MSNRNGGNVVRHFRLLCFLFFYLSEPNPFLAVLPNTLPPRRCGAAPLLVKPTTICSSGVSATKFERLWAPIRYLSSRYRVSPHPSPQWGQSPVAEHVEAERLALTSIVSCLPRQPAIRSVLRDGRSSSRRRSRMSAALGSAPFTLRSASGTALMRRLHTHGFRRSRLVLLNEITV